MVQVRRVIPQVQAGKVVVVMVGVQMSSQDQPATVLMVAIILAVVVVVPLLREITIYMVVMVVRVLLFSVT